ncbi:helix-turn-helix domain-containing protein [Thermicanus aegyptius]|uniref:helix-turn-helix domain-containing protein n=1 Tax=Thermicanus aegyptius TaxID=94009 RepID=UPI00048F1DD2|nr:helix-turn-helix transcriptional regulator [Thermicanus aegyptius]
MPVKCHLSALMGKHKMTIQDVHEKTKLNRNTISNLYHEKVTRIDFETIEKLCGLFGCTIAELFEYIPNEPDI